MKRADLHFISNVFYISISPFMQITLVKWTEYLLDFLEMDNREKFSSHITTIRRGHYGLLETHVKLGILRELVEEALITTDIREKLDERIEQQQALRATKREETRKKKEEQELGKDESEIKERNQKHILGNCNGKHKSDSLKGEHKGKDKDKEVEKKKPEETQVHSVISLSLSQHKQLPFIFPFYKLSD